MTIFWWCMLLRGQAKAGKIGYPHHKCVVCGSLLCAFLSSVRSGLPWGRANLCNAPTRSSSSYNRGRSWWKLLLQVVLVMRGFSEHFSLWPVYSIPVLLSAISVIVTGKPNEASKLRALCVAEMRKVWECQINTKGPSFQFWELCKRSTFIFYLLRQFLVLSCTVHCLCRNQRLCMGIWAGDYCHGIPSENNNSYLLKNFEQDREPLAVLQTGPCTATLWSNPDAC